MTYTLWALFLLTGNSYPERVGLTLQHCAGQAALVRQQTMPSLPKLDRRIGKVRYLCLPEKTLTKRLTEQRR